MWSALGHVLPIALAVAMSTVPITATILILLSPNRNRSGLGFLIGWVLGMAVVVVLAVLGARTLPVVETRTPGDAIGIAEIIVGAGILVFGIIEARRAAHHPKTGGSTWLDRVGSFGPFASFGLAFALNFRPKGLLLGVAAGLSIAGDVRAFTRTAIAVAFYLVIASSTVVVPIVATLVSPKRMQPRLVAAHDWLDHNSQTVTAVILLIIGAVIVGAGLSRL